MAASSQSTCYCCTPHDPPTHTQAMDVDSALHELGMLSVVTDSRKQYLRERSRRKSESAAEARSASTSKWSTSLVRSYSGGASDRRFHNINANNVNTFASSSTHFPSQVSSGAQCDYEVLQINPRYVTGFSTGDIASFSLQRKSKFESQVASNLLSSSSSPSNPNHDFGNSYREHESLLELEARRQRISRFKLGRIRRFRKPYHVPWRICSLPLPETINENDSGETSPDSCSQQSSVSNNSSPVKCSELAINSLYRSKSLDDLNIDKLKISDVPKKLTERLQRLDIEQMSQKLANLLELHVSMHTVNSTSRTKTFTLLRSRSLSSTSRTSTKRFTLLRSRSLSSTSRTSTKRFTLLRSRSLSS